MVECRTNEIFPSKIKKNSIFSLNKTKKCTTNIHFLNLLHLHVSVTADHRQGARCYRVTQAIFKKT